MKTLEATQAAAGLGKLLNQVRSLHASFCIVKQGVPYGCLVPAVAAGCDSHELADDLAGAGLSPSDRRAYAATIRKGRAFLKPLKNPWG